MHRIFRLGQALGRYFAEAHAGRRIHIIGLGGISHDPPVPNLAGATPELAERLIAGHFPGTEALATRAKAVIGAAKGFADGSPLGGGALLPLNSE